MPTADLYVTFVTNFGNVTVDLFETEAPISVNNFLHYVPEYQLSGNFMHRLAQGFVLQGGGYRFDGTTTWSNATTTPIQNEYSASRPNTQGTIAWAKLGGNPNSATDQFFFNLTDNTSTLGPANNGGYSVFGKVTSGWSVIQQIAALPVTNLGSPFNQLPTINYAGGPVLPSNLVTFSVDVNPTILGTVGAQTANAGSIQPFNQVVIDDLDVGQTLTVTVTFAAANGTLSGGGFAGGNGVYTVSGSEAQVQAALRAATFTPAPDHTTNTTLTISVSDGIATTVDAATSVTSVVSTTPTEGADVLTGSPNDDAINGLGGDDSLMGGGGNDTLDGASGADKLTGAAGSDRFVFTAAALADAQAATPLIDWITDFNRGNTGTFNAGEGDRIDVTALVSAAFLGGQQVGNLVRVLSDGTNARLQVDADGTANGSGWVTLARVDGLQAGNQLGVFVNGTASAQVITVSGSETISNQDGSRVEHRVDALEQQSYTDYFISYDALNRVTSQLTNYDDGSHINQVWDVQSQNEWANYYITYDSQNHITGQVTQNDDTTNTVQKWDVANAEDWADYYVTYDGQNRPVTQVTHNDDGSRIVFKWDRDNQEEWSDYRVTYDSQDRPITQVTNNDDGSRIVFKWDLDNQFSWADYRVTDSQGQSISQVTNNDDGTHQTYGWDVNNQASWSDYVVTTDSQGRATEQTTHYDDGTYTVAKWDVQNQFGWREMTDYYDAQGQHVQQRGVYDDGTPWVI
jgi:peptidyl-prolyl cis-trans isomerase A (cyclophilin A)